MGDPLPGGLDDPVVFPVAASVVHVARDLDGGVGGVADVVVPHCDVVVPSNLGEPFKETVHPISSC